MGSIPFWVQFSAYPQGPYCTKNLLSKLLPPSNRETIRNKRISRLAEIPLLYHDWLR